jgi:hypothetical protein
MSDTSDRSAALANTIPLNEVREALWDKDDKPRPKLITTRQARCVHGIPGIVICRARHQATTWRGFTFRVVD